MSQRKYITLQKQLPATHTQRTTDNLNSLLRNSYIFFHMFITTHNGSIPTPIWKSLLNPWNTPRSSEIMLLSYGIQLYWGKGWMSWERKYKLGKGSFCLLLSLLWSFHTTVRQESGIRNKGMSSNNRYKTATFVERQRIWHHLEYVLSTNLTPLLDKLI